MVLVGYFLWHFHTETSYKWYTIGSAQVFANEFTHGTRRTKVSRERPSSLTEWDFDIPRDNRFHDPFKWQSHEEKSEDHPVDGNTEQSTLLPPKSEAA
jgi:hypothetical protein